MVHLEKGTRTWTARKESSRGFGVWGGAFSVVVVVVVVVLLLPMLPLLQLLCWLGGLG